MSSLLKNDEKENGMMQLSPLDDSIPDQDSSDEFPEWYPKENHKLDARAVVKFFTSDGSFDWVARELEGENMLFELVECVEIELWGFSDGEIQYLRSAMCAPIEHKTYFEFRSLRDLMNMFDSER
ncbi:DUF2958 domain-containing protein [Chloroflexota bacterium]